MLPRHVLRLPLLRRPVGGNRVFMTPFAVSNVGTTNNIPALATPAHSNGRRARFLSSNANDSGSGSSSANGDNKQVPQMSVSYSDRGQESCSGTTTSSKVDETDNSMHRFVYVHPLSQIILEYLQDCRHDWIMDRGLDQALTLHRDGSFELQFGHAPGSAAAAGSDDTSTSTHSQSSDDSTNSQLTKTNEPESVSEAVHFPRIWTSYDEHEKKHWLTVQIVDAPSASAAPSTSMSTTTGSLNQRFLLQDNLLPAWHGNRKSLPERIHVAVDELIRSVDRWEAASGSSSSSSSSSTPIRAPTPASETVKRHQQRRR